MNYVAAFLLLVMRSEEHAFWMLATLLEDILYEDSYSGVSLSFDLLCIC
jgi:hypothetical protein